MHEELYRQLARHMDKLPGGYPPTESGVELRILRQLFTPEEAKLALHLTMLHEEARVIARRACMTTAAAEQRLQTMAKKGIIYSKKQKSGVMAYSAIQFVVGIWEFQVNRLTPELAGDFEEYLPTLAQLDAWQQAPQMRTIPVGESIPVNADVMIYEQAEELVRAHSRIAVAPCICRQEMNLLSEGCAKPMETCLSFGSAADFYERNGLGRKISREEALDILQLADEAGLVLQPANAQNANFLCCCCGDCCAALRIAKTHPQPAAVLSSNFVASLEEDDCTICGLCVERCQMEALEMEYDAPTLNSDRCIGCGLCVSTCPTGALSLVRKPLEEQKEIPASPMLAYYKLGRVRGKMPLTDLASMVVRSGVDRLLARD